MTGKTYELYEERGEGPMITYRLEQEKAVFIHFAELLNDDKAKTILEAGEVAPER